MDELKLEAEIRELRSALDQVDRTVDAGVPRETIKALGDTVDGLRTKVWAYLTTHQAGDLNRYMGEVRVRRAAEACEDVLAELYADALPPGTPGLELLRATLLELKKACDQADAESPGYA